MPNRRQTNAPVARGEGADQSNNDRDIIAHLRDRIKARIQTGETVAASDYPTEDRAAFWAAIALLRDEIHAITSSWRTLCEWHVDGRRLRERTFRLGQAVKELVK